MVIEVLFGEGDATEGLFLGTGRAAGRKADYCRMGGGEGGYCLSREKEILWKGSDAGSAR